jgi:hypothetical protein
VLRALEQSRPLTCGSISSEELARPHFFRICREWPRIKLLFRPFSNNRSYPQCSGAPPPAAASPTPPRSPCHFPYLVLSQPFLVCWPAANHWGRSWLMGEVSPYSCLPLPRREEKDYLVSYALLGSCLCHLAQENPWIYQN